MVYLGSTWEASARVAPLALLLRRWDSLGTKPAIYKRKGAESPWVIPAMADAAEVGGGCGAALSKFIVGIFTVSQESSDFGPELRVLEEGSFCVDIELGIETVSGSSDFKAFDPHGVNEAGEGLLAGDLFSRGGFVNYGLEELLGGVVVPHILYS